MGMSEFDGGKCVRVSSCGGTTRRHVGKTMSEKSFRQTHRGQGRGSGGRQGRRTSETLHDDLVRKTMPEVRKVQLQGTMTSAHHTAEQFGLTRRRPMVLA